MRQLPDLVQLIWRKPIWRINPAEKSIYLTFDDGPNPSVTPQVLDILDAFHVKATFFCVGENVSKYPAIFNEVVKRGHAVGNHTFNHLKGYENSTNTYVENVMKAGELIKSRLFRPPHGRITLKQIRALKNDFKIIMWDFITYDYDKHVKPAAIMDEIRRRSRNGSIVVFHDSLKAEKNMLHVLPKALRFWNDEGYSVKAIVDL